MVDLNLNLGLEQLGLGLWHLASSAIRNPTSVRKSIQPQEKDHAPVTFARASFVRCGSSLRAEREGRAQAGIQAKDSGPRSNCADRPNASSSRCDPHISFSRNPVLRKMEGSQLFPTAVAAGKPGSA